MGALMMRNTSSSKRGFGARARTTARRLSWLLPAAFMGTVALVLLSSAPAHAYPQWQFSSGAIRCNQCHFSPSGGGLINGYGRDKIGDDLSMIAGDGSFAHGAVDLPSWLALGFNGRFAYAAETVGDPNGTTQAAFPMQAQLQARVGFSEAWSFVGTADIRGQIRTARDPSYPDNYVAESGSRVLSNEHYVMWRPKPTGWYARAGRFFAPFGLRLAEHTVYVMRDNGFNTDQETYNVSGGYLSDQWELHVTAFAPDVVRHIGGDEAGGAAYFERRLGDSTSLALQARGGFKSDMNRVTAGAVGKSYIDLLKVMVLAEADLETDMTPNGNPTTRQFVGAGGLAIFPYRGFMLTALGERKQTSIDVANTATNALTGFLSWFPYPHFEVGFYGRMEAPSGQGTAKTMLAQIHYFL